MVMLLGSSRMRLTVRKMSRSSLVFATKIFQNPVNRPKNTDPTTALVSASQQLMLDLGLISHAGKGLYHILPVGVRALDKLIKLIDRQMLDLGAEKFSSPILGDKSLWERTGRWELMGGELFRLSDRLKHEFCLQPTHEEAITSIVASVRPPLAERRCPIQLYQIGEKFRDEMNPRFGLLRSRAFLMKDLYSFDANSDAAKFTYDCVMAAYAQLFRKVLRLNTYCVRAQSGNIGGDVSHEFHLENPAGQDFIYFCRKCDTGYNREVIPTIHRADHEELFNENARLSTANNCAEEQKCAECNSAMDYIRTVEIGHTFLLGTKYSEPFKARYTPTDQGASHQLFSMGCYGIGVTRLLAASIDALCLSSRDVLRWPRRMAPYTAVFITPKLGSKEEARATPLLTDLAESLSNFDHSYAGEMVVDDRKLSVGRRAFEAKQLGYPYLVIGNKTTAVDPSDIPKFELIDTLNEKTMELTHSEVFDFFRKDLEIIKE